ncbi:MAG TPA: arsenate reductase family protein [Caulobacteraceae bacterium]|jgi:arsenate reductase|nr:arsenate reductase family protein [Caulobacteraceae bacterium]
MTDSIDNPSGADVMIYHNPSCGASRNVLAAIRASGREPKVVEYLKAGWTKPQLTGLLKAMGKSARDILRVRGTSAKARGLTLLTTTEAAIIEAMIAEPILVERPIVATSKGAALCRPASQLDALL